MRLWPRRCTCQYEFEYDADCPRHGHKAGPPPLVALWESSLDFDKQEYAEGRLSLKRLEERTEQAVKRLDKLNGT